MASKKPAAPAEAPATPTFREAADASAAAHAKELEELTSRASAEPATPAEAPSALPAADVPPAVAEDTYDAWYAKQPEKYRAQLQQQLINKHAESLAEYYGPEVSALLQEVGQDPELKKKVARMSDKQYRQWLLDTSTQIYDDPMYAPAGAPQVVPEVAELKQKYDKLESQITKQQQDRAQQEYLDRRKVEYHALLNTFPELKWVKEDDPPAKRVRAVLERAEERRASYADTYQEMRDMWDWQKSNPPPRAAPPAQAGGDPPRGQAPKNKIEAKQAIRSQLDKFGSLSALNNALAKR